MPEATLKPQKRVLGDATKNHHNALPISPNTAKKRKLDKAEPSPGVRSLTRNESFKGRVPGSSQRSQQKSHFEEEVLEKLTQDISGLKESNSEKDQQWERPPLVDFNETRDSLCFQQIDVEDGVLPGGKTAVRLFGVTEV
jgi:DNA polymerase delta subunit 1